MCGRYTIGVPLEELMLRYHIDMTGIRFFAPRYNVAPGQPVPAVLHDGSRYRLGELRWGLVPEWAADDKLAYRTINARAETIADKPAFRGPFQRKRCVLPADSFYEWKAAGGGKQPMRIMLKSGALFGMAGLYDTWVSPEGAKISTCTVITTTPNELVAGIHDRMPVILRPEDEPLWLDRSVTAAGELRGLLRPYPAEEMTAYPVSSRVGNVRNDDPACAEEIRLLL